jgi:class 3 adenylate cyclase
VGIDVHRAARIAGAAHGRQVVLSWATAELVGQALPDGVELLDLGSHQLKDIPLPEHLLQVGIDELAGKFPPLKTLARMVESFPDGVLLPAARGVNTAQVLWTRISGT